MLEIGVERIVFYHNPKCSKCQGALELLLERNARFDIVEYLKSPPNRTDLEHILRLLPDPPAELVRKDANFKALGLNASDYESAESVIELLLEHPELMQRPLAVRDDKAILGRPPEKLLELL